MKFKFLFLLIITSLNLCSQSLVLTQAAYEPIPGDSSYYHVLDTNSYASGLPLSTTGNNSVWNFGSLVSTSIKANSAYLLPSAVPGSSNYPTATMVQKQGGLYNYFKSVSSPSTQTEMLGINSNTLNLTFTNTAILAKFPVSYGNSFTDNISGTFNFSISGTFNGSLSTQADGSGTLHLPGGLSLNNVLRVKSVQTIQLYLGFIPFGTAKQTVYNYFHASQKFPVLNITYSSLSITGSATPSLSAVVTGNSKSIIVGLNEWRESALGLRLYPNPMKDEIFIELENTEGEVSLDVFDSKGTKLLTHSYTITKSASETLSLKELANGFYFVNVRAGNQVLQKKIVVLR